MLLYRRVEPGVLPQPVGNDDGVDARGFPPRCLIAVPVNGPMVGAAERDGKFIADPAPHGPWLHESEVMGVRGLPSTEKARLRRHELQMGAIAVAARFAQGQRALVNMPGNGILHRRRLRLRRSWSLRQRGRP